jgi:cytochrome b
MRFMDKSRLAVTGPGQVKVWDPFVRLFHWVNALLVVGVVLSAHYGHQELHMALGIDLLVLVAARLLWGAIGPEHARLRGFVTRPGEALRNLREILRGRPRRHLGHSPAGALMAAALLSVLAVLLVTGVILQATLEFEGPLVAWLRSADDDFVAVVLTVHQASVYALYMLVPLHLAGVALASLQHRENLVWAMVTGYKSISIEEG